MKDPWIVTHNHYGERYFLRKLGPMADRTFLFTKMLTEECYFTESDARDLALNRERAVRLAEFIAEKVK